MITLTHTDPTTAQMRLHGRVDVTNGLELRAHVDALLAGQVREVRLDLSGVDFLDSAGLAAIIRLVMGTRRLGGDVVLTGTDHPPVERMLDLTGFRAILTTAVGGVSRVGGA